MAPRPITLACLVSTTLVTATAMADDKEACWEKLRSSVDAGCACFETLATKQRAPDVILDWGKCEQRRGKPAAAMRLYQEARPHYAGSPGVLEPLDAQIAQLSTQVGKVTLRSTGTSVVQPRFDVDGMVFAPGDTWVDPGAHRATLLDGAVRVDETSFTVAAGASIVVELPRPAVLPPEPPRAPTQPSPDAAPDPGTHPLTITGAVVLAVGGVGIVSSIVTGAMIVDAYDTAESAGCPRCDGDARDAADRGASLTGLNTASWIVAAVGVAGGITMIVVGETALSPDSPTVSLSVGPGGLSVTGAF